MRNTKLCQYKKLRQLVEGGGDDVRRGIGEGWYVIVESGADSHVAQQWSVTSNVLVIKT